MMSQRTILETVAIAQGKQVLLQGKAAPSTSQRLEQPHPPGKQAATLCSSARLLSLSSLLRLRSATPHASLLPAPDERLW